MNQSKKILSILESCESWFRISLYINFIRFIRGSIILLVYIILFFSSTGAQPTDNLFIEPITEAGLVRMLPALKAEAREIAAEKRKSPPQDADQRDAIIAALDSVQTAVEEIKTGELNPLEWITDYSRYLAVPVGVSYDPVASRIESVWNGVPTALFTFGIEASAFGNAVIHNDVKALQEMTAEGKIDVIPDHRKVNSILDTARLFYRDKKFIDNGLTGPLAWSFTAPDSSLTFGLYEANIILFHGCTTLSSGPLIEIECGGILGVDSDLLRAASLDLLSLLERCGIPITEYLNFKTALFFARGDAKDSKRMETSAANRPNTSEARETFETLTRMIEVRKMNADLYSRYATILNPLLTTLDLKKK
ncbi:MAG: hypothetical protein Q8O92_03855 [Candidatus Latescibacter sp.]|nr:hypothetical protein [Candidatus Latescibacter sp.]